jgi:hypothetical protein
MRSAIVVASFVAIMLPCGSAHALICKYSDPDRNLHYSNAEPESGWRLQSCGIPDLDEAATHAPQTASSPIPRKVWTSVDRTDRSETFIRGDSIRKAQAGTVKAWFLVNEQFVRDGEDRKPPRYLSTMLLYRIDCTEFRLTPMQAFYYLWENAEGKPVASETIRASPEVHEVRPDSIGEAMVRTACKIH